MTGFIAGMPFLGDIDKKIRLERLETPRVKVPKGAVGITEQFANIYTFESPGGWNILGNTPIKIFDQSNEKQPTLINPGDKVLFYEINKKEYIKLNEKNKITVLREGINSTFQDLGRNNFYHIGLPFSGAMDKRNYLIANKLVGNKHNEAVIEFAYQGPLIKIEDGNINFAISGDIKFNIKKNGKLITGDCYKNYNLSKNDEVDIISTNNSVYGYFAVSGGFELKKNFGSFSTHVRSNVGANNGNKISKNENFFIKDFER